jgi:hypothetical protein
MGNGAAVTGWRVTRDEYQEHVITTLAGLASRENHCLVPANSFAEYAPESNPETGKKDVVWFALNESRPLFAFAGIWTEFKGDRGTKSKPVPGRTTSMVF